MARQTQTEIHTADLPIRDYEVLDMTSPTAPLPMAAGVIENADPELLKANYAEQLAFAEEPIEIRIEPGRERFSAQWVPVGVNGDNRWLPVGKPIRIQRKFVENLIRAQPFSVETDVGNAMVDNPHNRIRRETYRAHPLSILHDPNPKGRAWFAKVSMEG